MNKLWKQVRADSFSWSWESWSGVTQSFGCLSNDWSRTYLIQQKYSLSFNGETPSALGTGWWGSICFAAMGVDL
jgi:hypothetical protein